MREKVDRFVMRSLFSLLVVTAKPYTRTHMVAEGVSDPSVRHRSGLFEVAACGSAPQVTGTNDEESDIALHDNHCDNTTCDDVRSEAADVQLTMFEAPHSAALMHSTGRVAAAAPAFHNDKRHSEHSARQAPLKCVRMRGGGPTQDEDNALVTLSQNGTTFAKRLFRKVLVVMYDEGITLSDTLDKHSLVSISNDVADEVVTDDAWAAYNCTISWGDAYEENDEEYYDCSEDTVDWAEGDKHVGGIVSWNDARNYGVIFVMDDYSTRGLANADWSSQLFCHISNFVDGEDCTLDVLDSVQFTVMWDYERERWHAVSIAAETPAAFEACKEKLNMSPTAVHYWHEHIEFTREYAAAGI